MAMDMLDEGMIDEKTAVLRVSLTQLDEILHPVLNAASEKKAAVDEAVEACKAECAKECEDACGKAVEENAVRLFKHLDGNKYAIGLFNFDDRQRDLQPKTLTGDGASGTVGSGTHRLTWDVAADYPGFDTTALDINVEAFLEPIPAVEGVTASQGTSEGVELTWSPVDKAVAYEIWRSESENLDDAELIATAADAAYSDMAIEFGKVYFYWVRPLSADSAGEYGGKVVGYSSCRITFDANGGEGTMSPVNVIKGGSLTVPACTFTYVGKVFVGWAIRSDGDVAYVSGQTIDGVTDNLILYAVWEDFKPTKAYLIVDLSSGENAEFYPLSELDDVPSGGWTDEYKMSKLVLRRIANGSFTMGTRSTDYYPDCIDSGLHDVTISKPFYMGVFEVTQRQYELVMGANPSYFTNATCYAARPVERVSYDMIRGRSEGAIWPLANTVDVTSFMGKIRAKTGQAFDLPTEAQWEYACRAGTTTALNSGKNLTSSERDSNMNEVGRYHYNFPSGGTGCYSMSDLSEGTAAVGSYQPNSWGLYDMHGNVGEWCLDLFSGFGESGSDRMLRGGRWDGNASSCRSAYRTFTTSPNVFNVYGFRLCCPAEP